MYNTKFVDGTIYSTYKVIPTEKLTKDGEARNNNQQPNLDNVIFYCMFGLFHICVREKRTEWEKNIGKIQTKL